MKLLPLHRMVLAAAVLLLPAARPAGAQLVQAEILAPPLSEYSDMLPVVVRVLAGSQQVDHHFDGTFTLSAVGAGISAPPVRIIKGIGTVTAAVVAEGDFVLSLEGLESSFTVPFQQELPLLEKEGILEGNETWTGDNVYLITGDLTVPAGVELMIGQGTIVLLAGKANIFVEGGLQVNGEAASPVRFQPADKTAPWGGVQLLSTPDSATFNHCFFIGGGGDEGHIFGHSQSQPVVMVEGGQASFTNCSFIDNAGKAASSQLARVRITDCIVSRCDTGGEHHESHLVVTGSRYTEMPDSDGIVEDDDNDGIYIAGNHPDAVIPSLVEKCVFVIGEDDGIDHNGANLDVMHCWIDGFFHEGVAASNMNTIRIFNTLVKNCEQGIEAGYGTPQVEVDHCTVLGNGTGIRFGDSYAWGCEGHLQVTNSILSGNDDNVLNFDNLLQGPVEGAVDITYTMTNDPDHDGGTGCTTGTPQFDADYLLLPGSAGTGLAMDGTNMGLVSAILDDGGVVHPISLTAYPNPFTEKFVVEVDDRRGQHAELTVFDGQGRKILVRSFQGPGHKEQRMEVSTVTWPPGIYVVRIAAGKGQAGTVKILRVHD